MCLPTEISVLRKLVLPAMADAEEVAPEVIQQLQTAAGGDAQISQGGRCYSRSRSGQMI